MNLKNVWLPMVAFAVLAAVNGWGQEANRFPRIDENGTEWTLSETRFTRLGKGEGPKPGGEPGRQEYETPIEVTRFELSRTASNTTHAVWSAEQGWPKVWEGMANRSACFELTVWDVAERDDEVFVLWSTYGTLKVDVQIQNILGQWETRKSYPLGRIYGYRFSGELRVLSGGVRVETAEWKDRERPDERTTTIFEVTEEGVRECPGGSGGGMRGGEE